MHPGCSRQLGGNPRLRGFRHTSGGDDQFTDADFHTEAWFIETYEPGLDPQTILLDES